MKAAAGEIVEDGEEAVAEIDISTGIKGVFRPWMDY